MKKICGALILLAGFGLAALADGLPDRQACQKAIASFVAEPLGPDSISQANTIVVFAKMSKVVTVEFSPESLPWLIDPLKADTKSRLLAAFVAGSVQSQLDNHVNKDDRYAGWLSLISVYNQLKAADVKVTVPSIEKMAALEKKGQLKQFLATASTPTTKH